MSPRLVASLQHTWASLQKQHPTLRAWSLGFNNNKRRLGVCRFREHAPRVEISRHAFSLGESRLTNTLLHEAAHALAGQKNDLEA